MINQWLPQSLITTVSGFPPSAEPSRDETCLGGEQDPLDGAAPVLPSGVCRGVQEPSLHPALMPGANPASLPCSQRSYS